MNISPKLAEHVFRTRKLHVHTIFKKNWSI